ncbi:MAG: DUF2970 domain-containing protein [Proteobacteria bacterium]|nr:DUF2970 domain-containing protein [Pseudomonadota bacterium]
MTGTGEQPKPSLWRTVRTVAWAMFGVRGGRQHRGDQESLRPLQVVGIGLAGVILLVLLLMGLVHWLV